MSDDPDMDQLLDAPGAQRRQRHLPEVAAVIAEQADPQQQPHDDDKGAPQIGGVQRGPRDNGGVIRLT